MAVASTEINPGAFNAPPVRDPRAIARSAARALRKGDVRTAVLTVVADTANLIAARAGDRLPRRYRCSCCGHEAYAFRHLVARSQVIWSSGCPRCNSRSRHRGLAVLIPDLIAELGAKRVLHFAPEPVLRSCFVGLQYETADLYLSDVTHGNVDLRALPFSDGTYDLIVCNHVLEHLPEDGEALRELARVCGRDGAVVITVPGDFRQQATQHFTGELENGHYRHYGLDFGDRLRGFFSRVDVRDLHDLDRDPSGLSRAIRPRDVAFVCRP